MMNLINFGFKVYPERHAFFVHDSNTHILSQHDGNKWSHMSVRYKYGHRYSFMKNIRWDRISWKLQYYILASIPDGLPDPGILNYKFNLEEIETDASGYIYGYKILLHDYKLDEYYSPIYYYHWKNNELEADDIPEQHNINGIYIAKSKYNPDLEKYYDTDIDCILGVCVKLLLSGKVIETRFGMRAQHAKIVQVISNRDLQGDRNEYWQNH